MPISYLELVDFVTEYFVETGSYAGDGIKSALDARFDTIYSIELVKLRYLEVTERFKAYKQVNTIHGDSCIELPKVLEKIGDKQATLFLDAHGEEGYPDPVIKELEAITKSGFSQHILLLDDMWQKAFGDLVKLNIIERIWNINSKYKLYFIRQGTILVADPR